MSEAPFIQVRCPNCNRMAAEAAPGSRLRVKCTRCRQVFGLNIPRQLERRTEHLNEPRQGTRSAAKPAHEQSGGTR